MGRLLNRRTYGEVAIVCKTKVTSQVLLGLHIEDRRLLENLRHLYNQPQVSVPALTIGDDGKNVRPAAKRPGFESRGPGLRLCREPRKPRDPRARRTMMPPPQPLPGHLGRGTWMAEGPGPGLSLVRLASVSAQSF